MGTVRRVSLIKMLAATLAFLLPSLSAASDCRLFTVGECTPSNEIWVDEKPVPCDDASDVDVCVRACQSLCKASDKCKIFSYSLSKQLCTLIQEENFMNYLGGCDVFAGPGNPLIEECANDHPEDPCERFIGQDCIYEGNQVLNLTDVTNAVECQGLLDSLGSLYGASLFVHDASPLNLCELRDSTERTCDAISGPEDPVYSACPPKLFF